MILTPRKNPGTCMSNANLYHLAITDGLTQLYINRYFRQKLQDEIRRSKRFGRPVSLILLDIDHFKQFNDTYGHQQGDLVLVLVAKILRETVRETDIPCRYGGEEFVVVLPETGAEEALGLAERLRTAIADHEFPGRKGETLDVLELLGCADLLAADRRLAAALSLALARSAEGGSCWRLPNAMGRPRP